VAGKELIIGVLALQGAVSEHLAMIEECGARGVAVKRPSGLDGVHGLIIPGGESTTIGKLIYEYRFESALLQLGESGVPVFGTCAGLILLANRVEGRHGPVLGLADVSVRRNAFGRQVDSFQEDVVVKGIEDDGRRFDAVFIRAPVIEGTGAGVEVMARLEEGVVMARDRNYLLGAFHPELSGDSRVHDYFLRMVRESAGEHDMEV
jgi:pyridoxal 5'-phosphate synthase pdxT subunit